MARPEVRFVATPAVSASQVTTAQLGPSADGREAIDRAVEAAARQFYADREVEVMSFYDKGSGRFVHRVADQRSGEILMQSPPDALLRFFASGREPLGPPLVRLEA